MTPNKQTVVDCDSPLFAILRDRARTAYFLMGEHRSLATADPQRFIATIHVLDSIAVLAHEPSSGTAFGADIHLPALRSNCHEILQHALTSADRRRVQKEMQVVPSLLPEVTSALAAAFTGVDPASVSIHIAGGHKSVDDDFQMAAIFESGSKWNRFSFHVRRAVAAALPGAQIKDALLLRFPGVDVNVSAREKMQCRLYPGLDEVTIMSEARLCRGGQRYELLAMDRVTGCLVSQTVYQPAVPLHPAPSSLHDEESSNSAYHAEHENDFFGVRIRKTDRR